MELDLVSLPYASVRQPVFAPHGAVATSHPLAAQAGRGLDALQCGGNVVDAALGLMAVVTWELGRAAIV